MSNRIQKINEVIKSYINDILLKNLSLKSGVFLTISKVDTTSDLSYTRVFVSIYPEKEINYGLKTLEKEIYRIQGHLNQKLRIKKNPKIEFHLDDTESRADKIEKLLQEI